MIKMLVEGKIIGIERGGSWYALLLEVALGTLKIITQTNQALTFQKGQTVMASGTVFQVESHKAKLFVNPEDIILLE